MSHSLPLPYTVAAGPNVLSMRMAQRSPPSSIPLPLSKRSVEQLH